MYLAYQTVVLRSWPGASVIALTLRDFGAPCAMAWAVAWVTWYSCGYIEGRVAMIAVAGAGVTAGWIATLVVCQEALEMWIRPRFRRRVLV